MRKVSHSASATSEHNTWYLNCQRTAAAWRIRVKMSALHLGGDRVYHHRRYLVRRHRVQVLPRAQTDGHSRALYLAISEHEHVGHFLRLRLPDAVIEGIVIGKLHAHAHLFQAIPQLLRVFQMALGNRQNHGLYGCQPHRESTGVVLNEKSDGALVRAQRRAVDA